MNFHLAMMHPVPAKPGFSLQMFFVPIYIEAIRARPLLVFWAATLAQAAVWIAVPMLFYSAPPGDLAQLLAIGHEFRFDAGVGPPLAYWLAEIAFRAAGLFGVYVLAQICVVTTYWCVFALGRAIVGPSHAAMAVLLMVGIALFTVPSPDFGPPILTMALWAVVLLQYWQAVDPRDASAHGTCSAAPRRCCSCPATPRSFCSARLSCSRRSPSAGARRSKRPSRGSSASRSSFFCSCI